jgi:uncharacterized protein (TIGR03382 family)
VRVDLVVEQDERVRQFFGRFVLQSHRSGVEGVDAEAALVLGVVQGVGWLMRRRDAAGSEREL